MGEDLTNRRYGNLLVVGRAPTPNHYAHNSYWYCKCDCGNTKIMRADSIKNPSTHSCGCRYGIYSVYKLRLHKIWSHMIERCENPNKAQYKNYGGRGIKVCEEWRTSYEIFAQWAYSHGYSDALTIDRIDPNGDYCPQNCRWITIQAQQSNKRTTVYLTYMGETKTMAQWSRELGINDSTIQYRLSKGWSDEKTLSTPINEIKRTKYYGRK